MNTAIYFDIGGVLIPDHLGPTTALPTFEKIAPKFGFDPKWATDVFQSMQERLDLGHFTLSDLGLALNVNADSLTESLWPADPFIPSRLDLVRRATDAGYKVGLATNFQVDWLERIIGQNPAFPTFDAVCVSGRIGYMKPSQAFYREAERLIGTQDVVFIDDRQANLDGAKNVGWRTILATGNWASSFADAFL